MEQSSEQDERRGQKHAVVLEAVEQALDLVPVDVV